ncbi:putative O-methyltransferase YrrM [Candidatus Methanophagaceae archaeon]|nr:putative O-methyltransferase YrrM [Methanophagales archaeon]
MPNANKTKKMNIPQLKANDRPLDEILYQGYAPNVISTAMVLGVFDALAEEPMNANTLSAKLGTIENITEAFANVLVALNLLTKNGADYSLTQISADFLVKPSPAYQGATIAMSSHYGQVMNQIPKILKNGPPKFDTDMWANIEAMKVRGQGTMGGSIQDVTEFIITLPEFANLKYMCDLGGSHGFYTMALLDKNPQLNGTVLDLPKVAELAKEIISEMGYSERINTIGADLETDDPIGDRYDLVFASHVIYEWKGHLEDNLKRINKAMVPGGIFVSNHLSIDDDECGPMSGTMVELMTRLMGYPTHHLSEGELKQALEASGFGDFTARPAEDVRQYRCLILAARKLGKPGDRDIARE